MTTILLYTVGNPAIPLPRMCPSTGGLVARLAGVYKLRLDTPKHEHFAKISVFARRQF